MATRNEVAAARARAEQAAAESTARAAEAQARAAEAQVKAATDQARIAAESQARAAQAQERAAKEARQNSPINRATAVAFSAAGPLVGIAGGRMLAHAIDKRYNSNVGLRSKQLVAVAGEIKSATKALNAARSPATRAAHVARLAGSVAAADGLKLASRANPIGAVSAGLLLAEGAYARFSLAPSSENETARQAFSALGTASAFGATTLVGDRILAARTPGAILDAKALASVEGARRIPAVAKALATNPGAKPAASSVLSTSARMVSRGASVVAVGSVAAIGFDVGRRQAAAAGFDGTAATALGAGAGVGAAGVTLGAGAVAGRVVGYVASRIPAAAAGFLGKIAVRAIPGIGLAAAGLGAAAAYAEHGTLKAAALGAVGLDSLLTKRATPAAAATGADGSARLAAGRLALGRAAAVRAAVAMRSTSVSARAAAARVGGSDGLVAGYVRQSAAGKVVRVAGYRRGR